MPINLLAICGNPGEATVKRVRTSAAVQESLTGYFYALEFKFREGIEVERTYDSRWSPGVEELATLPINAEATAISTKINSGILALEEIDGGSFEQMRIRALAVQQETGGNNRLLIQAFAASQRLSRKMAFISSANTFDRIDTAAFTLSTNIDVVIEAGLIKFKSYHIAKRVLDLSVHYKEATDADIRAFAQHPLIQVEADALIGIASQPLRKLISSVQSSGVLDNEDADTLSAKANGLVPLNVEEGKVVVPLNKAELRDLMAFLDHKIYRSPVDDDPYETNSHRKRT